MEGCESVRSLSGGVARPTLERIAEVFPVVTGPDDPKIAAQSFRHRYSYKATAAVRHSVGVGFARPCTYTDTGRLLWALTPTPAWLLDVFASDEPDRLPCAAA